MIVYGASLSPFVRKVLAFAGEKGIEVESRPVDFRNKSAEFLEASPFGKIPGFRDPGSGSGTGGDDFCISDSSAIIHRRSSPHGPASCSDGRETTPGLAVRSENQCGQDTKYAARCGAAR